MKRGRSTGKPTYAQQRRHDTIRDLGCIVAHMRGLGFVPCEIHHLTTGGKHGQKRLGHDHVIGLNTWSHRGEPFGGMTAGQCYEMFGPSYARQPRAFREQIGDDERLVWLQRELLDEL
jgi:RecA-dependent nuclease